MNETHPSQEELFEFSEGLITGASTDAISLHVKSCPACMAVLNDFKIIQNSIKIPDDHEPPELLVARLKKKARDINKTKPSSTYTVSSMFDFIRAHSVAVSSTIAACFVFGIFGISEYKDFLQSRSSTNNKALFISPVDMPINSAKNNRDPHFKQSNDAATLIQQAETLDHLWAKGVSHYHDGQYSQSIEQLDKALLLNPVGIVLEECLYYKALSHLALGENEKAIEAKEKLKKADPDSSKLDELENKI